jgi:hypothetical protein
MYRGIAHWRPLVNGYSSYYPQGFAEHMKLANRLPERAAFEALRQKTGLATIVVYADWMPNAVMGPWLRALEHGDLPDLRIGYRDANVLVLDVAPNDERR